MKYAAAMRFGGQLVEAIACDYNDYKYLGLLCPACKDPIFLRAESVRFAGEKEIKISPHFSHFPAKDATLAKICEQRVAQYTEVEIRKRVSQARGQRLRFFQRWFWDCFAEIVECFTSKQVIDSMLSNNNNPADSLLYLARSLVEHLSEKNSDQKESINCYFAQIFHGMFNIQSELKIEKLRPEGAKWVSTLKTLDKELHVQVVNEALDFLFSKKQSDLVLQVGMIAVQFARYHDPQEFNEYLENPASFLQSNGFYKGNGKLHPRLIHSFGLLLVTVPWADEFAKIQKQQSDRSLSKVA